MKQILQNLSTGETSLIESPVPSVKSGHCNIETTASLISAGTERMLVNFGQGNLLEKALQQPEKVKMVLDKVQTDGLSATYEAVKSKLGEPLPLGYCNVGRVVELGQGVENFQTGDRVVSNGPHASVVRVPKNLCAKIPNNVSDEEASFTVLASIALQGIRLVHPTLGERCVVIGAGLIGLCAIQLLQANGCKVLAIDFDERKLAIAKALGADVCNPAKGEDAIASGNSFSEGKGVDAVLITASSKSSEPISQAAQMSRKRGRIVMVGVTGMQLNRAEFYEKELSFQVSCSYGPGRYDSHYEENGNDYPLGFVRWTEQRNFEAILDLLSKGQLNFKPLITHRYLFSEAASAYQTLTDNKEALGIILQYTDQVEPEKFTQSVLLQQNKNFQPEKPVLGFIGAGNYASRILIPAFKQAGAQLHTLVTTSGTASVIHGRKTGFRTASTNIGSVFEEKEINTVVIATRHNTHAEFVLEAMKHGKHVFVEKPLAINFKEIEQLRAVYEQMTKSGGTSKLMLGFNRRFAPHIQTMKALLSGVNSPKSFVMTINAGSIPSDHWTQDRAIGGGRITGEACHFIDLMRFLSDSEITSVQVNSISNAQKKVCEDRATISLGFADGSFGSIHYLANGHNAFPKERIEVFTSGKVIQLDNFRKMKAWGFTGFRKMNLWQQDKGQKQCVAAFVNSVEKGLPSPIPIEQIFEVAEVTLRADEILRSSDV